LTLIPFPIQVKSILDYLYTGSMDTSGCSEEEMIALAEKFLLPDLVDHLGGRLSRTHH